MNDDFSLQGYGVCLAPQKAKGRCECIRNGWLGNPCQHFHSFEATSFETLRKAQFDFVTARDGKRYELPKIVVDGPEPIV